jgi:surface protein
MRYTTVNELMTAIANAIRNRKGTTEEIASQDMPNEIDNLPLMISVPATTKANGMKDGESEGVFSGEGIAKIYRANKIKVGSIKQTFRLLSDCTIDNSTFLNDVFSKIDYYDDKEKYSKVEYANDGCAEMFARAYITSVDFSKINNFHQANFYHMFYNVQRLQNVTFPENFEILCLNNAFFYCHQLKNLDFSNVSFAGIKDFNSAFGYSGILNVPSPSVPSNKAESLYQIFYGCSGLTTINFEFIRGSKPTTLYYAFNNCRNLTSIDFDALDTTNVTSFYSAFDYCTKLEYIKNFSCDNYNGAKTTMAYSNISTLKEFSWKSGHFPGMLGDQTFTFNISFLTNTDWFESFVNTIGTNTTGKTITIKIKSSVFQTLSKDNPAKVSELMNKGYNIAMG